MSAGLIQFFDGRKKRLVCRRTSITPEAVLHDLRGFLALVKRRDASYVSDRFLNWRTGAQRPQIEDTRCSRRDLPDDVEYCYLVDLQAEEVDVVPCSLSVEGGRA